MTPHSDYRPDIDGLRALAVVAVILFHAGFGVPGGYVGVDVFFVISGYLITSLILKEQSAGRFSLAVFWERRVRRIFPALAFVIGCTLVVGLAVLFPGELVELVKSAIAQLLLASNFYFWRHSGYFDTPSALQPLLHTWSLAVEEQFYLGFPLLLIVCRRLSRRQLQIVLGSILAASFALSVWGTYAHPMAAFYLLPFRAWELLIGALLATGRAESRLPRWGAEFFGWLGVGAIVFSFLSFGATTRFPGLSALLPCAGTALLIWSNVQQRTTAGKLLSLRPIVFTGMISYSLYLWHWPILSFMRYRVNDYLTVPDRLIAIALAVALACLSWRFVETPFRRRSDGRRRSVVFASAFGVTAGMLLFSVLVWQFRGLPQRFPEEIVRYAEENEFPLQFETTYVEQIERGELPTLGKVNDAPASFLLWGDSHAPPVASALDPLATKYNVWGYVTANPGVIPLLNTWRPSAGMEAVRRNQAVLEFIRKKKIKNVILVSDWEVNMEGRDNGSSEFLIIDDAKQTVSSRNAAEVMRRELLKTVDALQREGASVWIMLQIPIQRDIPSQAAFKAWLYNQDVPKFGVTLDEHLARHRNVNPIITSASAGAAQILDPINVCFDLAGKSLVSESARSYYWDRTHLTSLGAQKLLTPLFEPMVQRFALESTTSEAPKQRDSVSN